ncbi:hypothetical protein O181_071153 [Austropuccinia psidii MF-1]|uniref:Uncharacterized protein n=1 Tax=Austropuccinia psidii MF-1 TaxID=1389203 RepID=A0A9Q3F0I0_9BASI|nr:hypothetical protein [Austropuccinia psidii MF-1]
MNKRILIIVSILFLSSIRSCVGGPAQIIQDLEPDRCYAIATHLIKSGAQRSTSDNRLFIEQHSGGIDVTNQSGETLSIIMTGVVQGDPNKLHRLIPMNPYSEDVPVGQLPPNSDRHRISAFHSQTTHYLHIVTPVHDRKVELPNEKLGHIFSGLGYITV